MQMCSCKSDITRHRWAGQAAATCCAERGYLAANSRSRAKKWIQGGAHGAQDRRRKMTDANVAVDRRERDIGPDCERPRGNRTGCLSEGIAIDRITPWNEAADPLAEMP
jgi:hypothetical protein